MITDLELDTAYSVEAQSYETHAFDQDHFENLHLSGMDVEVTTLTVPLCELEAFPYIRRKTTSERSSTSVATSKYYLSIYARPCNQALTPPPRLWHRIEFANRRIHLQYLFLSLEPSKPIRLLRL
jgi:hypothetical protein